MMAPMDEVVTPFPTPDMTPPTTKMYLMSFFFFIYFFKYALTAKKLEIAPSIMPNTAVMMKSWKKFAR